MTEGGFAPDAPDGLDGGRWARVAGSPDRAVLRAAAVAPNTPPWVLARLARVADHLVVWGVSANPSTPPEALEELAGHPDPEVVVNVASNPNTPARLLARLAGHPDRFVARTAREVFTRTQGRTGRAMRPRPGTDAGGR